MFKRLLAQLLTLCSLLALLAGCGNGATNGSVANEAVSDKSLSSTEQTSVSDPETSTVEQASEMEISSEEIKMDSESSTTESATSGWCENPLGPASDLPLVDEPVTMSMWMAINPFVLEIIDDPNSDCAIWSELAARTGVNLEFSILSPDTQSEKFNLMIASDDLTDIISGATDIYTGGADAAIADEVLIDVSPYLTEELAPQISILLKNPAITDALTTDKGNIAGLPCIAMKAERSTTFGPIIRQDWLNDLGLEKPETYDDLYNVLVAFRDKKGATDALLINNAGGGIDNGLINGYGVLGLIGDAVGVPDPFYQEDGVVQYGPITEGFKEYLQMISKWYAEGLVCQDFMTYTDYQNPDTELILNDKTGVFFGEATYIASIEATAADNHFELRAFANPVKNHGDTIPFKMEADYNAGTPWSVSTACENVPLVIQWCNYMYTDEGATLCNYGMEGISFEYNEQGQPVFTDLILNNPKMTTTVALFMYCMDRGPFYRDDDRETSNYTEAQKEASDIWTSNMTAGRSMGSYRLTSTESEEATALYADIKTYVAEHILKFIIGAEDVDAVWDDYVAAIKEMGIDDVIFIHQLAYDRYLEGGQVEEMPGPPPPGAPAP